MGLRDDAAGTDLPVVATFHVRASVCPQLLCRLLGYVAQQDRVVDHLEAAREGDEMRISMSIVDIDTHRAEILAARMRNIISVANVELGVSCLQSGSGTIL